MTKIASWESKENVHIDLDRSLKPQPHHHVISDLIVTYCCGGDYLDIGCGLGDIPYLVMKKSGNFRISISDAYEICLEKTEVRLGGKIQKKYLLDEKKYDIKDKIKEKFDVISMSHVLEHLLDPVSALKDTLSLLKPRGILSY